MIAFTTSSILLTEEMKIKPFKTDELYDYFKTSSIVNGKKINIILARDKETNIIYPKKELKKKKKEEKEKKNA